MTLKEFFGFTRSKLILLIIFIIVLNIIPTSNICVDGINFGYCIDYHGLPFPSFIITGEVGGIPSSHLTGIITSGLIGFIGNSLIAYLVLSLVFFGYYKFKKK